ncbi:MAG: hypothetical protein ACLSVD_03210 [Eggerthellaceae bacterium]
MPRSPRGVHHGRLHGGRAGSGAGRRTRYRRARGRQRHRGRDERHGCRERTGHARPGGGEFSFDQTTITSNG